MLRFDGTTRRIRETVARIKPRVASSGDLHPRPGVALIPNIGSYFMGRDLAHCVTLDRRPNLPGLNGMLLTNTR